MKQTDTRARNAKSLAAETAFRARVAELGGLCAYDRWTRSDKPHSIICAVGHSCTPRPRNVLSGQGICRTCAGQDPSAAEATFRARVAELGGRCVYDRWGGVDEPIALICAAGHNCAPRPDRVLRGQGICRTCAGNDPTVTEAAFRARVAELSGRCVYNRWTGANEPIALICAAGHNCTPRPHDVLEGGGICRTCAGKSWDVFYLVINPTTNRLKFGITSGDPQPRLNIHARAGYTEVEYLATGLPDTQAPDLERAVLATLRLAGERSVKGREYYDSHVLTLVMDIVEPLIIR